MRNLRLFLCVLLVVGVSLRVAAVFHNDVPHGDIHLDTLTLDELAAGRGLITPLERAVELYPRIEGVVPGYPLDQHPPLMILLAWPIRMITGDSYLALRCVSLLAGLGLLLVAAALARRLYSRDLALVAAALVAGSFLLADFAGNGSIYTLHALLVLLAAWSLSRDCTAARFTAGIALGLAWLTNYQALVYLPAVLLAEVIGGLGPDGPGSAGLRRILMRFLAIGVGFALVASPWWLRNQLLFGTPFFSVNPIYAKAWFGAMRQIVPHDGGNLLVVTGPTPPQIVHALRGILVVNVRFLALQAPWWLAGLLGAAAIGGVQALTAAWRNRSPGIAVLPLLALAHLASAALWPATKFRYLVPWTPLLALLALYPVFATPSRAARAAGALVWLAIAAIAAERLLRGAPVDGALLLVAVVAFGLPVVAVRGPLSLPRLVLPFVLAQALLFGAAWPGSTTYYDGILLADAFGRRDQERAERVRQRRLRAIASEVKERGIRVLFADIELQYHLRAIGSDARVVQPLPLDYAGADAAALRRARERHGATHALATTPQERAFHEQVAIGALVIHTDPVPDDGGDEALAWTLLAFP